MRAIITAKTLMIAYGIWTVLRKSYLNGLSSGNFVHCHRRYFYDGEIVVTDTTGLLNTL